MANSNSQTSEARMPNPAFIVVFLALIPLLSGSMAGPLAIALSGVVTASIIAAVAMVSSSIEEELGGSAGQGI